MLVIKDDQIERELVPSKFDQPREWTKVNVTRLSDAIIKQLLVGLTCFYCEYILCSTI